MIIPITTNTTIATCIHIQVGDIQIPSYWDVTNVAMLNFYSALWNSAAKVISRILKSRVNDQCAM